MPSPAKNAAPCSVPVGLVAGAHELVEIEDFPRQKHVAVEFARRDAQVEGARRVLLRALVASLEPAEHLVEADPVELLGRAPGLLLRPHDACARGAGLQGSLEREQRLIDVEQSPVRFGHERARFQIEPRVHGGVINFVF